jgi:ketosteroid isomerase-like protein
MSAAVSNVDVIKALLPDPETDVARMFRDLTDPDRAAAAREAVAPFFDPEFEAISFYTPKRYRGPDGLRDFWLDWLEPWDSYYIGIERIVDDGDRVLVMAHDRGRRRDIDGEVEVHGGSVWTFREGRILRAEFYPSGAALEAAWPSG